MPGSFPVLHLQCNWSFVHVHFVWEEGHAEREGGQAGAHTLLQPSPGVGVLVSGKQNFMDGPFRAKDLRHGHGPSLHFGPDIWAQKKRLAVFSASEPLGLSVAPY